MSPSLDHIAIIGASAAGISAAEALRHNEFAGRISVIGAEEHLPYDRPPLSKQLLSGSWEPERLQLRTAEQLAELDIDLRLGTAAAGLDTATRNLKLADGSSVDYDGLILATGVKARRLPGGHDRLRGVHYLRTLDDALAMRLRLRPDGHLLVIGAGFIGAEAAAVARNIGMAVTMVEPAATPMARSLGQTIGGHIADLHTRNGVDLRCGNTVTTLLGDDDEGVSGALLDTGEHIKADVVVIGIGTTPATEWLNDSDLPLRDGALECDQFGAAGPNVYAAGDVAAWFHPLFGRRVRVEHRTNAAEQGRLAAANLVASEPKPFASIPYFWSDQYEVKLQAWGHFDGGCEFKVLDGELAGNRFVAGYGRNGRLVGAVGIGMPRRLMAMRALIAAGTDFADVPAG